MRKNKLFFYLCLLAFVLFGAISAQAKVLDASMKGVQNPALRIDVTQNQPHTIVLARNYLSSTIQNQTKTGAENNKISHRELEESLVLAGEYFKKAVKENALLSMNIIRRTMKKVRNIICCATRELFTTWQTSID